MKYEIVIEKKPLKFIRQQSESQQIRLYNAIKRLPQAGDVKKISGRAGYYRLRVGDYRIIFTIDHGRYIVCVVDAGNRGDIYKKY